MVSATAMLRVGAVRLLLLQQRIGMGGDERFLMQAEAQPVRKEADCRTHALIYLPFGNSTLIYHGEAAAGGVSALGAEVVSATGP
jgi:hypothetical protein